ncbi:MAG: glycosyltransferase family 4 protein [Nitrospirae bacterium]|nr:glycosyltransferase family 4 protein [Nitrospirota bacterium]
MRKIYFIKKKFAQYGGAELYMNTLINELKNDHEIHILSNRWISTPGVLFHKIFQLKLGSFISNLSFIMSCRKAVRSIRSGACIISFERTDCQDIYRAGEGCHAEWLSIRGENASLLKKLSFHLNPLHMHMLLIEKRLFESTPVIIANSQMVKNQIIRHYSIQSEKIHVIYNGVDLARFNPANKKLWRTKIRDQYGINHDARVALLVGSEFKRKGLATIIKALSSAKSYCSNLHLLVLGKGDKKEYSKLANALGISSMITFIEPQKEIERFYAASDIFILPTLYDPFSNATLEAMASGLPVITSKNNGAAEIIANGINGFILDNMYDKNELSDKLLLCLSNHETMGAKAGEKAKEYSIQQAAAKFIEIIRKLNDI